MEHPITRREMLQGSAILVGGVCLCQQVSGEGKARSTNCMTPEVEAESVTFGEKSVTIDLAKAASLEEVGCAANVSNKERKIELVVVHAEKEKYYAVSRFCTHAGRTLSYIRTRRVLMCTNSNHSIFDLKGQIVKGPAPDPLTAYAVRVKDGKLEIGLP